MKLTVVGCSPAWPNPGGAHSGYLLESGSSILLDCGPGVLARLREHKRWPSVEGIAITHFHLDHWGDLVPWVWGAMHLDDRGATRGTAPWRPDLFVPPGGRAQLEQFGTLLGFSDMFERVFSVREYAPDTPFDVAGFTLIATPVPHYTIDAYAFRVSHNSRTLSYSGDSGPSDALSRIAKDADLFVCEATLESAGEDANPRGHLALDEAVALFEASGAKRLLVTHRPQELDSEDGIALAHDGLETDV